jgi:uncharacterized protein YbjT (DUF2867 family)
MHGPYLIIQPAGRASISQRVLVIDSLVATRKTGRVASSPAGDTPEPFVDADELTGPRLLTFAEAVGEISRALGREIRYVPISIEDFAAAAAEQGVPSEVVEMLTFIFGEVLDGRNARLADGVQRALGREPRDFSDYARDAAATGIWNPRATRAA